jgi:hypothetical protein
VHTGLHADASNGRPVIVVVSFSLLRDERTDVRYACETLGGYRPIGDPCAGSWLPFLVAGRAKCESRY